MEFEDPEDLHGIEWDFLMHDRDGRIAVLTTAGAGPVPPAVNSKRVMVECAIGAVIELPIRGESIDQRPPYLRDSTTSTGLSSVGVDYMPTTGTSQAMDPMRASPHHRVH